MATRSLEDIKACPFCKNHKAGDFRIFGTQPDWYQVHCTVCGTRGPIGGSFDEAIDMWNHSEPAKGIKILRAGNTEKLRKTFLCQTCDCCFSVDKENFFETYPGFYMATCPCCGERAHEVQEG